MLSDDMAENLSRYYAWASVQDPSDITYPHETPYRRLLGAGISAAGLSDDEAMQIDRALCSLKDDDPEGMAIVRLVHRDRRSFRWLQARGYGDRKRLAQILAECHVFIRTYIKCEKIMGAQTPKTAQEA